MGFFNRVVMGFFNRVAGLFKSRQAPPAMVVPPTPTLRERIEDLRTQFAPRGRRARGYLTATHRTSHRTVAMDLRDAKKRRNIAKRKSR